MSNPIIPSDINSWSKAQTAEYYIDELYRRAGVDLDPADRRLQRA
jgi:hypothetical protein